jgi:hypothetical protein
MLNSNKTELASLKPQQGVSLNNVKVKLMEENK